MATFKTEVEENNSVGVTAEAGQLLRRLRVGVAAVVAVIHCFVPPSPLAAAAAFLFRDERTGERTDAEREREREREKERERERFWCR